MLVGSNRTWNMKVIASFLLVVALFAALVGASFAWLTDHTKVQNNEGFEATAISSYFGGSGDGSTADKAYLIQNETHLYNLAWLQNIGKISAGTYFKLDKDIDMAGLLNGTTQESGAIPPIGTDEKPFQGYFDGGGFIISNLWVSTNPDDWKEHPDGMSYSSTHVGLFGALGAGAVVENFNLDRVEITTSMDATVGIVCGLVKEGANISGVGVYNGILGFSASGLGITSNYSLIGEKEGKVYWENMPSSSAGGNIVVDPNGILGNGAFAGLAQNDVLKVPGSVDGRAYYSGAATMQDAVVNNSPRQITSGSWEYNADDSSKREFKYSTTSDFSYNANTDILAKAEINKIIGKDGKIGYVNFQDPPDITAGLKVTNADGITVIIPANCVWFDPIQSGTAAIVFRQGSQGSGSLYMSVWKYERVSEDELKEVEEMAFGLTGIGNGQFGYFEVDLEAESEPDENGNKKQYEYAIGASSYCEPKKNDYGFAALILAGASTSNGDTTGNSGKISGVDYIKDTEEIVGGTNYTQRNVLINISGTTAVSDNSNSITYLATETKVHCQNLSGLSVNDSIGGGVYSTETPSGGFKERDPGDTTAANN